MNIPDVIRSEAAAQPFSRKLDSATMLQLKAMNVPLSALCRKDEVRYALLSAIFNREITSSRQLTKADACALIGYMRARPAEFDEWAAQFVTEYSGEVVGEQI